MPTQIADFSDLNSIRDDPSEDYYLVDDIDASETQVDGNSFDPIEDFSGSLDGRNHSIIGLHTSADGNMGLFTHPSDEITIEKLKMVECEATLSTDYYNYGSLLVGEILHNNYGGRISEIEFENCYLDGYYWNGLVVGSSTCDGIEISNIKVRNCEIISNYQCGIIAGELLPGTVQNVDVDDTTVTTTSGNAAGIVGHIEGVSEVIDCHLYGTDVEGTDSGNMGGIASFVGSETEIRNCSFNGGSVTSSGSIAAGLVYNHNGVIENCSADCHVESLYAAGGLVSYGNFNSFVENSHFSGTISCDNTIGCIVNDSRGVIFNCYSQATVQNYSSGSAIGGVAAATSSGTIENTYAANEMPDDDVGGGIIGTHDSGDVVNTYWDQELSGVVSTDGGGTALSTSEMTGETAKTNLEGFEFGDVWQTTESYPTLSSSKQLGDGDVTIDIGSLEELNDIPNFSTYNYRLTDDIDASESEQWNNGQGFSPIKGLRGSFDGRGHTIYNLHIDRPNTDNVGLFSDSFYDGSIRNLTIEDAYISGSTGVGSFVGIADSSDGVYENLTAINVEIDVDYNAGIIAGGISGGTIGDLSVSNSSITGMYGLGGAVYEIASNVVGELEVYNTTINGTGEIGYLGGVVALSDSDIEGAVFDGDIGDCTYMGGIIASGNQTLTDCETHGSIAGNIESTGNIGGVKGEGNGRVVDCESDIDIDVNINITGTVNIGGIVGQSSGAQICNYSGNMTINVDADEGEYRAGGVIGELVAGGSDVYGCYCDGTIDADHYNIINNLPEGSASVGGLIGYANTDAYSTYIYHSYTTVEMTLYGDSTYDRGNGGVGGLIGRANKLTCISCYTGRSVKGTYEDPVYMFIHRVESNSMWMNLYYDELKEGESNIGIPLTNDEMTGADARENMVGFNFEDVWSVDRSYPTLQDEVDGGLRVSLGSSSINRSHSIDIPGTQSKAGGVSDYSAFGDVLSSPFYTSHISIFNFMRVDDDLNNIYNEVSYQSGNISGGYAYNPHDFIYPDGDGNYFVAGAGSEEGTEGTVVKISADDGSQLWKTNFSNANIDTEHINAGPILESGVLVTTTSHSLDSNEGVQGIDPETGNTLFNVGGGTGTKLTSGGGWVFLHRGTSVTAVDVEYGEHEYDASIESSEGGRGSILYHSGLLYVGTPDGKVICVDHFNTDRAWITDLNQSSIKSDIVVYKDYLYVLTSGDTTESYQDGEQVIETDGEAVLHKIDQDNGDVIWKTDSLGDMAAGDVLIHDDTLYFTTSDGVHAVDPASGSIIWRSDDVVVGFDDFREHTVISHVKTDGENLYVSGLVGSSVKGEIGVLDIEDGELIWSLGDTYEDAVSGIGVGNVNDRVVKSTTPEISFIDAIDRDWFNNAVWEEDSRDTHAHITGARWYPKEANWFVGLTRVEQWSTMDTETGSISSLQGAGRTDHSAGGCDVDGNIYLPDATTLHKYNLTTESPTHAGSVNTDLQSCKWCACTPQGDRIFVLTTDSNSVNHIEKYDSNLNHIETLQFDSYGYTPNAVCDANNLIVLTNGGYQSGWVSEITCFDFDLNMKWQRDTAIINAGDKETAVSPGLYNGYVYYIDTGGNNIKADAETGNVIWSIENDAEWADLTTNGTTEEIAWDVTVSREFDQVYFSTLQYRDADDNAPNRSHIEGYDKDGNNILATNETRDYAIHNFGIQDRDVPIFHYRQLDLGWPATAGGTGRLEIVDRDYANQ